MTPSPSRWTDPHHSTPSNRRTGVFNAKEYLEALQPPRFVAPDGTEYVGRILSADEWEPLQLSMRRSSAEGTRWKDVHSNIRRICDAMFPPPRFHRLRGLRSVADWISLLPPVGQMRAVWDFMQSQARAQGVTLTPSPGTSKVLGQPTTVDENLSRSDGSSSDSTSVSRDSTTSGVEGGARLATA